MIEREPAPIWWMVRVTPHDSPTRTNTKHFGPFKHEHFAIDFARRFDTTLAEAVVIPLVRGATHRLYPYMRGYQPPKEYEQPELVELEAEV